ncbi:MAG: NfeD family protein [Pyrinomonadaceae bacterium]
MDQYAWVLWLILGVGLIIAEVFTLGFVLLWFGIAAIAAALVGMAGIGFGGQFLTFAIVSIALTSMSRTIFSRYLAHGETDRMKTGAESLPGQIGTVAISSTGALNEAAVKVFGATWTAFPIEGESTLTAGEKVEVVEVKGSSIYVKRITNELPGWREP